MSYTTEMNPPGAVTSQAGLAGPCMVVPRPVEALTRAGVVDKKLWGENRAGGSNAAKSWARPAIPSSAISKVRNTDLVDLVN
ncbi:hypothetical protein C1H46_019500 [Malus baccata]|uniref:Uncharacterized protein n=1 Tax=Malus baccata TaxID=106549 RepID=A0A540M895_MALBA|nr:hypothetical protein C1H46_019500 [Malus baccata]